MKKRTFVFLFCCVLAIAAALGIVGSLLASRVEVEVTGKILEGDPALAAGLTARQRATDRRSDLAWLLEIPLDRPEEAQVTFPAPEEPLTSQGPRADWGHVADLFTPTEVHYDAAQPEPWNPALAPLLQPVIDRTAPGETRTETVAMADNLNTLPLYPAGTTEPAARSAVQDFFSFPVPEQTLWTVTVQKDDQGDLRTLEARDTWTTDAPSVRSTSYGEDAFLAFQYTCDLDFSQVPGGLGIYRTQAIPTPLGTSYPSWSGLENVYPLPEGTDILDLTFSLDGADLLLTYCREGTYTCEVLDPETLELRQALPIPAGPPVTTPVTVDTAGNPADLTFISYPLLGTLPGEDFFLLRGEREFHFYPKGEKGYEYGFSQPLTDHIWHFDQVTAAWNGETLALATTYRDRVRDVPGLTLSLYREGQRVYYADYTTSLVEPHFPTTITAHSPELTWN